MDSRGVDIDSPIKCDTGLWNDVCTCLHQTDDEFDAMVTRNEANANYCLNLDSKLIGHIDIISVIREMETLPCALHSTW